MLVLASCAEREDIRGPKYEYDFAIAEALPRTSLEPAPTSYVLFQRSGRNNARSEEDARVTAYCVEHYTYEEYESREARIEKDPFGNFVTFYWPIRVESEKEEEAAQLLSDPSTTVEARCDFLTEQYDWDRAADLLEELGPEGEYANLRGPVMVLDLVVDSVVLPLDNVKTEDVRRIPPIWSQAIDDALRSVAGELEKKRQEARAQSVQLEARVAELDNELSKLRPRQNDRREQLQRTVAETKKKKASLLKRWFGKGSWGRAFACVLYRIVKPRLQVVTGSALDALDPKMNQWCALAEPEASPGPTP